MYVLYCAAIEHGKEMGFDDMADFNHSIEARLFITIAAVALAILLPVWNKMHHHGSGYEPELAVAGVLATIATMYGTVSACDRWAFRTFFFYIPWFIFGSASFALLVFGITRSGNHWWYVGLGLVALMQLLAIFLPAIVWYIDRRETLPSGTDHD